MGRNVMIFAAGGLAALGCIAYGARAAIRKQSFRASAATADREQTIEHFRIQLGLMSAEEREKVMNSLLEEYRM